MKDVSRVDHFSFVQNLTNVPVIAPDVTVGARLHQLWEKMGSHGGQSKDHIVLNEGYALAIRIRLNWTRSPT